MPIRFNCSYCNQLMGIARRKAGTVVRCPSCSNQVIVPLPDPDDQPPPRLEPKERIFERGDFDEIFRPGIKKSHALKALPPGHAVSPLHADATEHVAEVDAGGDLEGLAILPPPAPAPISPRAGLWLTPAKATWLSVGVIFALALAFAAGLLVGLFIRGNP